MTNDSRLLAVRRAALFTLALACGAALHFGTTGATAPPPETAAAAAAPAPAPSEKSQDTTPTKKDLVQPEDLAKVVALPEAKRPVLVHVGFQVLYRGGHIAGSKFAGPGNSPKGRADLKKLLETLPKDRSIVLYCGCCPWIHCPNVNPAFRIARSMGYRNARILYVVKDMQRDWVDKGLPALVQ